MLWFNKEEKEKRLAMLQAITPTSKTSLKRQCLYAAKGNLKEAKELYEFFAEDLKDLPDNDPVPPTWQQNTANTLNGIMAWFKENQGTLSQGVEFVRYAIANKGIPPITPVEPAAALPSINEE
jgi:hypothetical protein